MAKAAKKIGAIDLHPENFNETRLNRESEHTHTDTDTHTHNDVYDAKPETKSRRVQLLTYGSLVDRMDAYGKKMHLSRAEVFEVAVREYLDRVDT